MLCLRPGLEALPALGEHGLGQQQVERSGDLERLLVALHGDVHHANILDFGSQGWLAIDPKGLLGERGYDYANPFCNPDTATALRPGRLQGYLAQVSEQARMEPKRLLMWILAYSALSAAWILGDGDGARFDLSIAELAAAELGV